MCGPLRAWENACFALLALYVYRVLGIPGSSYEEPRTEGETREENNKIVIKVGPGKTFKKCNNRITNNITWEYEAS
ncbi:hypothetical protein F4859DRAFT_497696 [Xylaria cf. heliscus]|nr:hypothetical protein F4859DRAFT_497696 [Xylaria cf. heliscus]